MSDLPPPSEPSLPESAGRSPIQPAGPSLPPPGLQIEQPPTDPHRGRDRTALAVVVALIVGAVVGAALLSRSSGGSTVSSDGPPPDGPDPAQVVIFGDNGEPVNDIARRAIADIEFFWDNEWSNVFAGEYTSPRGGFVAYSPQEPLPPCAPNRVAVAGNAYYCSLADVVAWDDTRLFPQVEAFSGELGVAVILAHEWGHVVQDRVSMTGRTITLENQADCYAGAWFQHVDAGTSTLFAVEDGDLELAVASFLQLADAPGTAATDPMAHGSGFDRVSAFQDGLENGAGSCATYRDDNLVVTELPFNSVSDFQSSGNLPIDDITELTEADLEGWWSLIYADFFGGAWQPLRGGVVETSAVGNGLACASGDLDRRHGYCAGEDAVLIDRDQLMPTLYDDFGDFAISMLQASGYGEAVFTRAGLSADERTTNLASECLAGAWAASIFPEPANARGAQLVISPGDLDEVLGALLSLSASADAATVGTGFDRVTAFRAGVLDGVPACIDIMGS